MKFNYAELTRFIGYLAGVLVGLAFVGYGLATGDLATAVAGASSLGVSLTALPNVPKSRSDEFVVEPEIYDVPTSGSEKLPKHGEV